MTKASLVGGAFVTLITLLAACGGMPSGDVSSSDAPTGGTVSPDVDPCPYDLIDVDPGAGSLPEPVRYPVNHTLSEPVSVEAQAYDPPPFQELEEPPEMQEYLMKGRVRNYHPMVIEYSDPTKKRIAGCGLSLRTYNGELVGPTLRVKPGQTLRFSVKNNLPGGPEKSSDEMMMPHVEMPVLDTANLHTHGAQVDPGGDRNTASDNVLIQYGPGESQDYEIKVPDDHPTGTFWYHAHAHGSTAVQVASGMAGALIVEDDRNSDNPYSDRSLLPDSLKNITEKTMIFQSILYDTNGRIANLDVSDRENRQTWSGSNRRVTINGQLVPKITMRPGEIQRWRMIGATFGELLRIRLAEHDLNEIALDGHYLPRVDKWEDAKDQAVDLQAGYRSDVLVRASATPGTYLMINFSGPTGRLAGPEATTADPQSERVLAAVVVEGSEVNNQNLPTDDEMKTIAYGWNSGLENRPLEDQWNDDPRPPQGVDFTRSGNPPHFSIDNKIYNPEDDPRILELDKVDQWQLRAGGPGHIFHIHTNPFQVVRTGPSGPERVWKDTILVPQTPDPGSPPLLIYTQYKKFLGDFVIHCHLLDHEDDGMMQKVRVVP